jgi:hypothetical protein
MYIHQLDDWPRFTWNRERVGEVLATVRHRQGRLIGHMEALGFRFRQEAVLETLTADVLKSSEIEGERLDREQVRSSIARRLGIDIGALKPADRIVEGVVEIMLDATQHYDRPLTAERLFDWQASLFATGRSGMNRINVGAWRDDSGGPMQVVSGPLGKEHVHFEAPEATRVDNEMQTFLDWFNGNVAIDPVLKAGLAHLWFSLSIHSTMAMAALHAPSPTWLSRVLRAALSASIACPRRSAKSVAPITLFWSRRRKERWTLHPGWSGSSTAWCAPWTARKPLWGRCSPKRDSGRGWEMLR